MHLLKYTDGWTRRHFMSQVAKGILAAGVLSPLWDVIARTGDVSAAYPPELLSLDAYTKGKIKAGDVLSAENVDIVKDLLDPFTYIQIKNDGRLVDLIDSTTNMERLNPKIYLEATLKNKGLAVTDKKGNAWTKDGKPWIGGNPFPEPKTAEEVLLGHTMSWGRHDSSFYPVEEWDMDSDGNEQYHYQYLFIEYMPVGRLVLDPHPYLPQYEDKLRFNTIFLTYPVDQAGTGYLNIWPYDQTRFPTFYGYLPQFKRIRTFPTDQRFDPLWPGSNFFLTDAWMTGDPVLTWGNFKLVGKAPLIQAVSSNWDGDQPNWLHKRCGGKTGKKYFRCRMELVPEVYIVDLEPVKYPRSPYGRKRIWFDARTLTPLTMSSYDRQGKLWKQWEGAFGLYQNKSGQWPDKGEPYWSWTHVINQDIQSGTTTMLQQVKEIYGGHQISVDDPKVFTEWCSPDALKSHGV